MEKLKEELLEINFMKIQNPIIKIIQENAYLDEDDLEYVVFGDQEIYNNFDFISEKYGEISLNIFWNELDEAKKIIKEIEKFIKNNFDFFIPDYVLHVHNFKYYNGKLKKYIKKLENLNNKNKNEIKLLSELLESQCDK